MKQSLNTSRLPLWFAGIALTFGSALVFLTPPFQVTDEFWHFFRAYQISLGQFVSQSGENTQGGVLPFSLLRISNRFSKLPFHPAEKTSVSAILDAAKIPLDPGQQIFCHFPTAANYCPLVYAPQTVGIALGRWLGFNPLAMLYFGREMTLLAWIVAGYFSLRLMPMLRQAVFIVLLMPMTLCLAASVSADAMTIAISILFTALVFRLAAADGEISLPTKIALFACSIAVSLCKFAYLPLIFLVALIPPARFGTSRRRLAFVAILTIANFLAAGAWLSQTAGSKLDLRPDRPDVNFSRQLSYVGTHPIASAEAMFRGLEHHGLFILQSFVGNLGWIDTPASPFVVALFLIALAIACIPRVTPPPSILPSSPSPGTRGEGWGGGRTPNELTPNSLCIIAAAIAASIFIFCLLNYLAWTPVGNTYLQGIQGRYFIPLAPAIFILLWGILQRLPVKVSLADSWQLNLAAIALGFFGGTYALFLTVTRYYLAN
jgi:uncharacterized membrane protein